ncbi:MAG: transposase [Candidatus Moranbacteria bacterium]|nr:transposase [Candidatus Moranbacteria bacterium]
MQRREPLVLDEYYHIYNRGVEKRQIFSSARDYSRFLDSLVNFNTNLPSWKVGGPAPKIEDGPRIIKPEEKLVDIVSYCLNPNHFHLILKQRKDQGITTFIKKVCTGYAMYFNKKYDRSGVLFQGRFKSVLITSNEQLLYVSAYVNCNSEIHELSQAENYPWSSFRVYLGEKDRIGLEKEIVLGQFSDPAEYKKYAVEQIKIIKENKKDREADVELE